MVAVDAFPNIPANDLREILRGFANTMQTRLEVATDRERMLQRQIDGLADRVMEYEETYNTAPEGYVINLNYPDLRVPIGNGLYRPAKWVKQEDHGLVSCYTDRDGEHDQPILIPVYAKPVVLGTEPIKALPKWFRSILRGSNVQFAEFLERAKELDDWGVAADCDRYRNYTEQMRAAELAMREAEEEYNALEQERRVCEARLEASRAATSLSFLEGLARNPGRQGSASNPIIIDDEPPIPVRATPVRGRQA